MSNKFTALHRTQKSVISLAIVVCLAPQIVAAQSKSDDVPAKLAAYMEAAVRVDKFSGSVLVSKDGKTLLAAGYGMANLEHEVPNSPETKFRLGSITKQFTAAAILMLQDQGKLKVDDPIEKHLESAPDAWDKITIHHLLTHTSGISSYTSDPSYGKLMAQRETTSSMIARFKDKPLEFEPGEKFEYSNSGYFLLGVIIERASGKDYETFLREAIFQPLAMNDSGYDRHTTMLPKRAAGYERRGDGPVNAQYLDMNQPYAAGSLYSTVEDLYKWHRALQAGKLVSKEGYAAMYKPFRNAYAYGWMVAEQAGRKQVGHGGGINGFATHITRFPDDDLCVVALSNVLPSQPGKIAADLARIALGETVAQPKERTVVKVDEKILEQYVGRYELSPAFALTVTRDGARLLVQATGQGELEVFPESETLFFAKQIDIQLEFVKENDKVVKAVLHQNGKKSDAKRTAN